MWLRVMGASIGSIYPSVCILHVRRERTKSNCREDSGSYSGGVLFRMALGGAAAWPVAAQPAILLPGNSAITRAGGSYTEIGGGEGK